MDVSHVLSGRHLWSARINAACVQKASTAWWQAHASASTARLASVRSRAPARVLSAAKDSRQTAAPAIPARAARGHSRNPLHASAALPASPLTLQALQVPQIASPVLRARLAAMRVWVAHCVNPATRLPPEPLCCAKRALRALLAVTLGLLYVRCALQARARISSAGAQCVSTVSQAPTVAGETPVTNAGPEHLQMNPRPPLAVGVRADTVPTPLLRQQPATFVPLGQQLDLNRAPPALHALLVLTQDKRHLPTAPFVRLEHRQHMVAGHSIQHVSLARRAPIVQMKGVHNVWGARRGS